jgi:hypothetical protein
VVQRRTMSHTDMGIVGATNDSFILFENDVRRNRLVLPGLSNAADHFRLRSLSYGGQVANSPFCNGLHRIIEAFGVFDDRKRRSKREPSLTVTRSRSRLTSRARD